MYDIGSIWRKWDLHVHTPDSFQHDYKFESKDEADSYGNDIWEKYIAELEKFTDIAAIGITDYFSLEGYRKIIDYKANDRLSKIPLILPNIEFRLDKFLSGDADRKLNFHVIFNDQIPIDTIETEFLNSLTIKTQLGEDRALNRNSIEEIGSLLKRDHPKFRDRSDYFIGCMNISISLDAIFDLLENKKSLFGGNYLFILPEERWSNIGWDGQDHLTRKQLFIRCHALFSSNENTKEWALGNKDVSKERFIQEFCTLKPCVHGSDAHTFDRLCKPDENRFCWIKSDPSFEGLKQICYEPEMRVKVQEHTPEPRKNIYTLKNIKIGNSKINPELTICEQDIPLNSNMIAIIGGKGSGKTAALDLIANCFEDRSRLGGLDQNSFIQRIEDQKPDLSTSISFINNDSFMKTIAENNFFPASQITHLPQDKIAEYSSDKIKLHKKITEIIYSNRNVIDSGYLQKIEECKSKIISLNKTILELNRDIFELELETKNEIIKEKQSAKKLNEGNLKNKNDELIILLKSIGKDETDKVEKLKTLETELSQEYKHFESSQQNLIEIQTRIESLYEWNINIEEFNQTVKEFCITDSIPIFELELQLKVISEIAGKLQKGMNEIVNSSGEVTKELNTLSGFEKNHAILLKEIKEITDDIETIEKEISDIYDKKKEISKKESERNTLYANLLDFNFQLKEVYDSIIQSFSKGKDEILENIDFKSKIEFDHNKFNNIAEDIFDLRKISADKVNGLANILFGILNRYPKKIEKIHQFINLCLGLVDYLKNSRKTIDLYNWLYDNYFSLGTEIFFSGIYMDKLSIGQKGTVLLKILLAEGDHPLIIDQPEENLDNKFVYEFLVDAFRRAKDKRQIIIATHNANLVVNTDAEQIIVAEFKDNEISYSSGSIENQTIRNSITTLLEGGEEAFKKREAKYGYTI